MFTKHRLAEPVACKSWATNTSLSMLANSNILKYGSTIDDCLAPICSLEDIYNYLLTYGGDPNNLLVYGHTTRAFLSPAEANDGNSGNTGNKYSDISIQQTNHFILDVDNLVLEGISDYYNLEDIVANVVKHLHKEAPEFFPEDTSCVGVASGSMWKKQGEIKVHLHFVTEKPTTLLHMKALVRNIPELKGDPAIYSTARCIFTAPPRDSNLPQHLLDMRNRVVFYKGKSDYVTGVHTLTPCLPNMQGSSYKKYALKIEEATKHAKKASTLFEVLPLLSYGDKRTVIKNLNKLVPKHPTAISDMATVPARSIVCAFGRASSTLPPSVVENVLGPILSRYSEQHNKGKNPSAYTAPGFATQHTFSDQLLRRDLDMIEQNSYTKYILLPENEINKLILPEDFASNPKETVFLKAPKGTGKTTAIKKGIADGSLELPVLYLSPLRAVAAEVAASCDLTHYQSSDYNKFLTVADAEMFERNWDKESSWGQSIVRKKTNGISIVINSLTKEGIEALAHAQFFKTIIIDEADAVLKNIVTLVSKADQNKVISSLRNLREYAKHTIILDGDLSRSSVEIYNKIFGNCWYSKVYEYKTQTLTGVPTYAFPTEKSIMGAALTLAQEGKRILIVSDMGPSWVETAALAFRSLLKDKVVEVYHSEAVQIPGTLCYTIAYKSKQLKEEMDMAGVTCSPSQYAMENFKVHVLIASPSMVSAQDLQGYFDVVVSINNKPYGLNLRLQAIARERKPKAIFFYVDTEKLSSISYTKQFKPCSQVLMSKTSSLISTPSLRESEEARLLRKIRSQYDLDNALDLISMNIDCKKIMEQFSYTQLMRCALLEEGVRLYEIPKNSTDAKEFTNLYKSVYTEELKEMYSTHLRMAILTETPNVYATRDFINTMRKKVQEFYGESTELTDDLVNTYLSERPDLKGQQLLRLQKCDDILANILTVLRATDTNWYGKEKQLVDILMLSLKSLTAEKVYVNQADISNFVRSLAIDPPTWDDRSKYCSIVPEDYSATRYIQHALSFDDSIDIKAPAYAECESMMEIIE